MPSGALKENLVRRGTSPNQTVIRKIKNRRFKFVRRLLLWSKNHSPEYPWRHTSDPYHVMVAEMLLRRTRAHNAVSVYEKFFETFPSVFALAEAPEDEIKRITRSLGLMSRSKTIKSAAQSIVKRYDGTFPSEGSELHTALGSGSRYTVNAIRCFAFGQRVPIFDVNVKRIFERVFSVDFGTESHKREISWEIVSEAIPRENVKQYNWSLLDLGKAVCTPANPGCGICPLQMICDYGLKHVR
jgi:A/G-specific adenine glycosylase